MFLCFTPALCSLSLSLVKEMNVVKREKELLRKEVGELRKEIEEGSWRIKGAEHK